MQDTYAKNNFIKNSLVIIKDNFKFILIILTIIFTLFIVFQIYNYINVKKLKETSIEFFDIIETNNRELIFTSLEKINNSNNIYSILSDLKLIQMHNSDNNFKNSNKIYLKLIEERNLDNIYLSAVASHAAFTLINASYKNKSDNFLVDIQKYISLIDEEFESFKSLKYELQYLSLLLENDINKLTYKENSELLDLYNIINNSDEISSSVKERVKKIHDYQFYKK